MKKILNRILATILTLVMLLTAGPLSGIVKLGLPNVGTINVSAAESIQNYNNVKFCKVNNFYLSLEGNKIYKYDSKLKNKSPINFDAGYNSTTISTYNNIVYFADTNSQRVVKYNVEKDSCETIYLSTKTYSTDIEIAFYDNYIIISDTGALCIYDTKLNSIIKSFDGSLVNLIGDSIYYQTGDNTNYVYLQKYSIKTNRNSVVWHEKCSNFDDYYQYAYYTITDVEEYNNRVYFTVGSTQGSGRFYYGNLYCIDSSGKTIVIGNYDVGKYLYVFENTLYITRGCDGYAGNCGVCRVSNNIIEDVDLSIECISNFDSRYIACFNYFDNKGLYVYDLKTGNKQQVADSNIYLEKYKNEINEVKRSLGGRVDSTFFSVHYYCSICEDAIVFYPEVCIPKGMYDNTYHGIISEGYTVKRLLPSYKLFNENSYIADIWLDRHGIYTTPESKLINDILSYDSISSEIYNDLRNNSKFYKSVVAGEGIQVVFDPVKQTKQLLNEKDIYETLILDLLEKIAKADNKEFTNIILDAVDSTGDAAKEVTKYKGIIDNLVGIVDNPDKMLLSVLKEWQFNPNCTSFQSFYASLNNISDTTGKWSNSKFVEGIGAIADGAKDVADFYKRFTGYLYVIDMAGEMVSLLNEMYKNTDSAFFKDAISDVLYAVNDVNYAAIMQTCELGTDLGLDVINAVFGEISKGIPVYGMLRLAYKAGKAFDDLFLNTSKIIDKFYLVQATNNFINANKASIGVLKYNYLNSKSDVDAGAYVYAIKAYHYVYEIDLESAVAFAKEASNEGLWNYAKRGVKGLWNKLTGSDSKTSYQSMSESKDSIIDSLNYLFNSLDNSWKFNEDYLQKDYPEIYPIYLDEEISQNVYTPGFTSCYLEKNGNTSLTWSTPYIYYDESGNCFPLYASIALNGISMSETVGISKSKKDYYDVTDAPNPVTFRSSEYVTTFPKTYKIESFSTTSAGNVYTKSSTKVMQNPLKPAKIELAVGADLLNNLGKGIAINIVDNTESIYSFIKYKVYRSINGKDWSLLKTVGREFLIRGNTTLFVDEDINENSTFYYKVISIMEFDNGKTLTSAESNQISVKGKKTMPSVSNVTTRRLTNNEPVFKKSPMRLKSASNNNSVAPDTSGIELSWNSMNDSETYDIYRMTAFGTVYNLIASVDGNTTSYVDGNVENGVEYYYIVLPCSKSGDNKSYEIENYAQGKMEYFSGNVNSVSSNDVELKYRDTIKLNPVVNADIGVKYTVDYKSSDTSVATVDKDGNIYANGRGTAAITCTVTDEYGNIVNDSCTVTVKFSFGQWLIWILLFGWIWY